MLNTGQLTLPSFTPTLALFRAAEVHPVVRYQIAASGLRISAATTSHLVSVHHRAVTADTSATATIDLEQAAGSVQLVQGKWAVNGEPVERRARPRTRLRPRPLPTSVRVCKTSSRTLRDLLGTFLKAPHVTAAVFDARSDRLRLAADGDVVRIVAAVADATFDGHQPVASSMPLTLAHAALGVLPADVAVTVTIGDGVTVLSAQDTAITIESLADNPTATLPEVPQPKRRRHDVSLPLSQWKEFNDQVHKPFIDTVPACHLRVRGSGDQQTLTIDVRSGGHAYHAELPCSTSDSFAIDVPWQSFQAALAPAITAGSDSVTLRIFDQQPTLTPLVVNFTSPAISGFAATVARKPLLMVA